MARSAFPLSLAQRLDRVLHSPGVMSYTFLHRIAAPLNAAVFRGSEGQISMGFLHTLGRQGLLSYGSVLL